MNNAQEIDVRRGHTSASNAEADRLCPGRHLAQRGLPSTGGKYADSGSLIHAALAKRDPSALSIEEREVYDACVNIEVKLLEQFFGEHVGKCRVFVEERFWAKFKDSAGTLYEHSGQPDRVYRYSTRSFIVDYKTGRADLPEAPTNEQCRDYVALTKGSFVTVDETAVVVIQPLVTHEPTPAVYDVGAMQRAEREMFDRVAASNNPQSPRHAGEVQCQFCAAKMLCHEYQKFAGAMVIGMNNILEVPVAQWTPEQRKVYCDNRGIAKKWLAQVDEQMKAGLEIDPTYIPGYELRNGAKREAINNPQECYERFAKLGGSLPQFMGTVAIGKTRLKKVLAEVVGAKGKTLDQALATVTRDIVTVTQTAPVIAKSGDTEPGEEGE